MKTHKIIEEKLKANELIKIELGCGPHKKEGFIGVDMLDLPNIDIVANFEEGLHFIPDSCVDYMTSSHLLEHIENLTPLMREIHRVLKKDGIKKVIVPHFSNPYYYSDCTHRRFFGYYTFDYFSNAKLTKAKRKVPEFYDLPKFEILSKKLVFSNHPFFIRNLIKAMFTKIFNISIFMQELYEGWFTWMIPCSEIHYEIKPIK